MWSDPDPSVSIGILLFVPFVIVFNLIIAGILRAVKRQYALAFLINSVISAIIMYNLFVAAIEGHQARHYNGWQFIHNDTTFNIWLSKDDTTFYINNITNPSSSTNFISGHFVKNGNQFKLISDSLRMIIKTEFLYGFKNTSDSVRLTKIRL